MSKSVRSPMTRVLGTLVTALLISAPGLAAQTGTVYGKVTDAQTGLPVARVQVFIFSLDFGGLSQQNGRYLLQNVPAGTHTLTVARIGYQTLQAQIVVTDKQSVEQNFAISLEAQRPDVTAPAATRWFRFPRRIARSAARTAR